MTHIIDHPPPGVTDRRRRWARIMSGSTVAGMVFTVAAMIWIWIDKSTVQTMLAPYLGIAGSPVTVTLATQLMGLALSAPPAALLVYLLLQARAIFTGFIAGRAITDIAAARVWRIGMILIAKGLLLPFWRMAASVLITFGNPPGQRLAALTISLDDILWAIVGGLLVAIGWTLREAARIADENANFV
ncbi:MULTISPECIES: hypothetical protein [unclassified Rhizobium]|uniref:hypothetical protein n=1 Tax=unclassified Rhizobium TaxID=2613769 RepID=UPI0018EAACFA